MSSATSMPRRGAVGMAGGGLRETGIQRAGDRAPRLAAQKSLLRLAHPLRVERASLTRGCRALGRRAQERRALQELGGNVAPRVHLALQLVRPGPEGVGPGLDRERVQTVLED